MYSKWINVAQSTVSLLQHITDPTGVIYRKRITLRKGIYSTPRPDLIYHFDSYDQVKPFGICSNDSI